MTVDQWWEAYKSYPAWKRWLVRAYAKLCYPNLARFIAMKAENDELVLRVIALESEEDRQAAEEWGREFRR